jgi:LuxR family quorum-sensing system transcriptional regulator SolR
LEFTDWQDIQLQAILSAGTDAALFEVLAKTAREIGFDYCAYGMRMPLPVSNPKTFMLNNYSSAWQERYREENYLAIDPTVAHGARSVLPLIWDEPLFRRNPLFWDDVRSHGLEVGWAQSSYDAKGVAGMLTLARAGDKLSESELRASATKMNWLVQVAHEGMTRMVSLRAPSAQIALTAREVDVLRWTADGKTSSEVGEIMNISERTVNFHINNSLEKLGAVNKTAGVIKAAMMRLL